MKHRHLLTLLLTVLCALWSTSLSAQSVIVRNEKTGTTTQYPSFEAAITEILKTTAPQTLTLLEDITLSSSVAIDRGNITIEFNGKTIRKAEGGSTREAISIVGGNVTFQDASGDGGIDVVNNEGMTALCIDGEGAKVNILGGQFCGYDCGVICTAGTLTISDGLFEGANTGHGLYHYPKNATVSISGGYFAGGGGAGVWPVDNVLVDGYSFYTKTAGEYEEITVDEAADQAFLYVMPATPDPETPDPETPDTPDPDTPDTPDPGTPCVSVTMGGTTTTYSDLYTAWAETDGTSAVVTLLDDVRFSGVDQLSHNAGRTTLRLDGHTLTTDIGFYLEGNAQLTIEGGEGGCIDGTACPFALFAIADRTASLTINGGRYVSKDNTCYSYGELAINSGDFESGHTTIELQYGANCVIEGGTFSQGVNCATDAQLTIYRGTFKSHDFSASVLIAGEAKLYGGTYEGIYIEDDSQVIVKGVRSDVSRPGTNDVALSVGNYNTCAISNSRFIASSDKCAVYLWDNGSGLADGMAYVNSRNFSPITLPSDADYLYLENGFTATDVSVIAATAIGATASADVLVWTDGADRIAYNAVIATSLADALDKAQAADEAYIEIYEYAYMEDDTPYIFSRGDVTVELSASVNLGQPINVKGGRLYFLGNRYNFDAAYEALSIEGGDVTIDNVSLWAYANAVVVSGGHLNVKGDTYINSNGGTGLIVQGPTATAQLGDCKIEGSEAALRTDKALTAPGMYMWTWDEDRDYYELLDHVRTDGQPQTNAANEVVKALRVVPSAGYALTIDGEEDYVNPDLGALFDRIDETTSAVITPLGDNVVQAEATMTAGNVILNLNGHSLTSSMPWGSIIWVQEGQLTVRGGGSIENPGGEVFYVNEAAGLTIEDGSYKANTPVYSYGSVTIYDGNFEGQWSAAAQYAGNIEINGGNFFCHDNQAITIDEVDGQAPTVKISGGRYTTTKGTAALNGSYTFDGTASGYQAYDYATDRLVRPEESIGDNYGFTDADDNFVPVRSIYIARAPQGVTVVRIATRIQEALEGKATLDDIKAIENTMLGM